MVSINNSDLDDSSDVLTAQRMYLDGKTPTDTMRYFFLLHEDWSIPHLMYLLMDAFALPRNKVQCIGGWWHDGTGELKDEQINDFLIPAIEDHWKPPRRI
jgi:hypothetical protein